MVSPLFASASTWRSEPGPLSLMVVTVTVTGVGDGVAVGQLRNKTDILFEPELVVARSWRPSPLKSPTAIELGFEAAKNWVGALKWPAPSPNKIETTLSPLVTARSCKPSPLKSPTAPEIGRVYRPKFVA